MEQIKSSYKKTSTHLYSFKIYETHNEYFTEYYTAEDAKIMWDVLTKDGQVFSCSKANLNDSYLEDVSNKSEIFVDSKTEQQRKLFKLQSNIQF